MSDEMISAVVNGLCIGAAGYALMTAAINGDFLWVVIIAGFVVIVWGER